jgi:hypothetical protein
MKLLSSRSFRDILREVISEEDPPFFRSLAWFSRSSSACFFLITPGGGWDP